MDKSLVDALKHCESIANEVADPALRPIAFRLLLERLLPREDSRPQFTGDARPPDDKAPIARRDIATLFRKARSVRERVLIAVYGADEVGNGVPSSTIRQAIVRNRHVLPGNLAREISELVRSGLVLPLGEGRNALYTLSQSGLDLIARLSSDGN